MYQSNDVAGGQLDARIEVYDGRLWVDRGGGNVVEEGTDGDADDDDLEEAGVDVTKNTLTTDVDSEKDRRTENKEFRTATVSQLLVDKAQMFHSGRYVCSALGTSGTWTLVHILAGKPIQFGSFSFVPSSLADLSFFFFYNPRVRNNSFSFSRQTDVNSEHISLIG